MRRIIISRGERETKKLGEKLAKKIVEKRSLKKAQVLGLVGDLGGGKTTFLQGFAKGLGIKQKITSPTFVIIKRFGSFYHIDCYRIQKPKELLDLGFKKVISDPKNIVAVEWADRIRKIMPKSALWLEFEFIGEKTRKIVLK